MPKPFGGKQNDLYAKLGFILLIFCAVAAGVLAYVNGLTAPVISQRKELEETQTRELLIPDSEFTRMFSPDSTFSFYQAKDKATNAIKGYAFIAEGTGYSSRIKTMVGVDSTFSVIAIKIIDQAETPGLGAKCQDQAYYDMYAGLGGPDLFVDKDGGKIKSITGATITTRAVTNSIREQINILEQSLSQEVDNEIRL